MAAIKSRSKYTQDNTDFRPHNFRLVNESTRITDSRRTVLEYKVGDSPTRAHLRTAEVDAISLIAVSSKSNTLFSDMLSGGIRSPLIEHLASCESAHKSYTHPLKNRIILVRGGILESAKEGSAYEDVHPSSGVLCHYKFTGGLGTFRELSQYDGRFFESLCRAIDGEYCRGARIDLCLDFSEEIMHLISSNISRGRVSGFGSHLRGYGELDGLEFKNWAVGPRSQFYWEHKNNSTLRLRTLYVGHPRYAPVVLVFYDKQQSSSWQHNQHLDKTRVECRLYNHKLHSGDSTRGKEVQSLMNTLLRSMSPDSGTGGFIRHLSSVLILFSHVHFSSVHDPGVEQPLHLYDTRRPPGNMRFCSALTGI